MGRPAVTRPAVSGKEMDESDGLVDGFEESDGGGPDETVEQVAVWPGGMGGVVGRMTGNGGEWWRTRWDSGEVSGGRPDELDWRLNGWPAVTRPTGRRMMKWSGGGLDLADEGDEEMEWWRAG